MSQSARILSHLQSGKTITAIDALRDMNCFRLAPRIHELRGMGHNITTKNLTEGGVTFAQYQLKPNQTN